MSELILRHVELDGVPADVAIRAGRIVEIGGAGQISAVRGGEEFDAGGGALLPGLHDHHIHLVAYAAALQSVDVGPGATPTVDAFESALRAATANAPAGEWIRAIGYHESVAGAIDRDRLDAIVADHPVRVMDRSGAAWTLNSRAAEAIGLDDIDHPGVVRDGAGRATGQMVRMDDVIRRLVPPVALDIAAAADRLAGHGVTSVTDLTPTDAGADLDPLAAAAAAADFALEVYITGGLGLDPNVHAGLKRGPIKIVVGDHALPDLDWLCRSIAEAHRRSRPVALHCVTLEALVLSLAAWDDVGSIEGDRIEHGAVIPVGQISTIAALGLCVVTQPSLVAERGDAYLADVDPRDQEDLWRCASLISGGVRVGGSTDAPFGSADPWRAIAAATRRRGPSGAVVGADQPLTATAALDLFLTPPNDPGGPPRRIEVGAPADLCLLRTSLRDALEAPSTTAVAAVCNRTGFHQR